MKIFLNICSVIVIFYLFFCAQQLIEAVYFKMSKKGSAKNNLISIIPNVFFKKILEVHIKSNSLLKLFTRMLSVVLILGILTLVSLIHLWVQKKLVVCLRKKNIQLISMLVCSQMGQ